MKSPLTQTTSKPLDSIFDLSDEEEEENQKLTKVKQTPSKPVPNLQPKPKVVKLLDSAEDTPCAYPVHFASSFNITTSKEE